MAPHNAHISILGAGIGGLATALALARRGFANIHVYETASNLGFVGAGIQLAPNMARVLDSFGVWDEIEADAVVLEGADVLEGATDKLLTHVDLGYVKETYGYAHQVGHRASLVGGLYNGCKRYPEAIKFHFSTSVQSVSSWGPRPQFTAKPREGSPYEVETDVLLACNGVKSTTRDALLEELNISARVVDTGQAAYRIMLSRDDMASDPELLSLIDTRGVTRWIGEKRHIIAYPVSRGQIYNISTVQPDSNFASAPSETYTTRGSKPTMLEVFGDFCPKVLRMLDLVPDGDVCEWKLRVHEPLPQWVHKQTALVGDACHPTLPHMAQGAAQAIEDGAVLGVVLGRLPDDARPEDINAALRVYQQLRKDRAYRLVDLAADAGRAMHLGEGKAKEERDRKFAELRKNGGKGENPEKWADADVQRFVYGEDVTAIAEREFERMFSEAKAANGVAH